VKWLIVLLGLLVIVRLPAQEWNSPDWNIDSIFEEPSQDTPPDGTNTGTAGTTVKELIKQRGFTFDAAYEFAAGISPGWYEVPWAQDGNNNYYFDRLVKMRSTLSMDAQISDVFRVKSTVYYEIPNFTLSLGDFFFDYSLCDTVFIRGGKYDLSWGISPNYAFTNLLARVPENGYSSDSFILKADIPTGIGGFQALALTRADLLHSSDIKKRDIGFGGKYNLALRRIDMDLGAYYQEGMPLRGFLSLKTTLGNTELYSEGLCAIDVRQASDPSGAVNLGFSRDFFNGKFSVNGELFYNAEKNAFWYRPETTTREAETAPFIDGLNGALNLLYRFEGKGNPRLFFQTRIAPWQSSAQIIPGFRLNPLSNIELYFALPMALGSKDGYYYSNTVTRDTTLDKALPFCVMLLLTLKGDVQFGYYY